MFNVLEMHRMTTHNGPGFRTCVHLMGCPLSCQWCSTPESQRQQGLGFNQERCIACGSCVSACTRGALTMESGAKVQLNRQKCDECFACVSECYSKALWKYGITYSKEELEKEILKDKIFFDKSEGGVTFSGGECLLSAGKEMQELFASLKSKGINICIDTCGHVPWENIELLLPYIDSFLWDVKMMDPGKHSEYTGADNIQILENLQRVDMKSEADIYIRVPLIPGINDSEGEIEAICAFAKGLRHFKELHFLPYHHLGQNRYIFSGREFPLPGLSRQSDEKLNCILAIAKKYGLSARTVG